jgi:F-type H+-transporting ATPase subunit b
MDRRGIHLGVLATMLLTTPGTVWASEGLYVGDLGQAIAAALIFATLLAMLGRFAWKPIIRQLRQRELHVASTLKRAARAESEAEDLREHYERRLARAQDEADRVVAQARKDAEDEGETILQTARARAQDTVADADRQIAQAQREALGELQETTVVLATDLAGKIVGKEVHAPDLQDELFAQAMDDIAQEVKNRRS